MSSIFYINLVNKETKAKTCLFELSTTPARQLDEEVHLAYDEDTLLTKEFYIELCDSYKSTIEERKKDIKTNEENNKELLDTIAKSTSKDAVEALYDSVLENKGTIDWCKDEIEEKQRLLIGLERVWEIFELNNGYGVNSESEEHYELWYYFS